MAVAETLAPTRAIARRTRGATRGPITRLMSPHDFGEILKPFVFLDAFDNHGKAGRGFALHPHSGIATITYLIEGSSPHENSTGADAGVLEAGGIEYMRAGGGVWHGGGSSPANPPRTRGYQLWLSLPPETELAASVSKSLTPDEVPAAGPARVLLGTYAGATSPVTPPSPLNYLAVTLKKGERWTYTPPAGHTVLWVATARGRLSAGDEIGEGELAAFAPGTAPLEFTALSDAEFMLGSAVPHKHDLVLGYYSVHTSPASLAKGEANIAAIQRDLQQQGKLPA